MLSGYAIAGKRFLTTEPTTATLGTYGKYVVKEDLKGNEIERK